MLVSISAVVALPKIKEYIAKKRLERGEKIPQNDEIPRTWWDDFLFAFVFLIFFLFQLGSI